MVLKEIVSRRSVRSYKADAVSDDKIKEIIKAAQFAPTAYGTRAVEFVVIKNQETKEKLFEILETEYLRQAPVLILPVINLDSAKLPVQDLSIASAHIFLQAAAYELGTVWKNLSPEMFDKVKEILNIPQNYQAINIIPIGYAQEQINSHQEDEFNERKIHIEKW